MDVAREDMEVVGEEDAEDRLRWKRLVRCGCKLVLVLDQDQDQDLEVERNQVMSVLV